MKWKCAKLKRIIFGTKKSAYLFGSCLKKKRTYFIVNWTTLPAMGFPLANIKGNIPKKRSAKRKKFEWSNFWMEKKCEHTEKQPLVTMSSSHKTSCFHDLFWRILLFGVSCDRRIKMLETWTVSRFIDERN